MDFKLLANAIDKEMNKMSRAGTSTSANTEQPTLTYEIFQEAKRMVEGLPSPPPVYFYSKQAQPDDVYQVDPGKFGSLMFFPFDRNTKTVYICGKNARDALIKEGVVFENYQPEEK